MGNLLGWGYLTNILAYSIGSLLLGIVLTIAGIALMFVLIRSWWRDSTFTPMSFLVGGILFFFLSYQAILLCGAVTIKTYISDVEEYVDDMVSPLPVFVEVPQMVSDHVMEKVVDHWPLIGYYANIYTCSGYTSENYAQGLAEELNHYINMYILRRVLWSLAFIVIGAVLVIKTISHKYNSGRRPERVASNRPQAPSRDHRPHVRRR